MDTKRRQLIKRGTILHALRIWRDRGHLDKFRYPLMRDAMALKIKEYRNK